MRPAQSTYGSALAGEFGQGFYFYKPLTRERAHAVLREHQWPVAAMDIEVEY